MMSGNDSTAHVPRYSSLSRPFAPHRNLPYYPGADFREEDTNSRLPVSDGWRSGSNSHERVPSNNSWNRHAHVPQPLPYIPHEMIGGAQDRWRLFEDRVRTGPYGLNGFPVHPFSPMRVVVLREEMAPEANPRLRQFIQESPPRIRGEWNMQSASEEEESKLTREEQKKALNKLKKQVYNPYPKKNKGWSLYYRDSASFNKRAEEQDDDDKSCAICLEEFVPRQEVLVTPCNHMFHDDCIVPWVKGNGQCPVCRFALGEQRRETARSLNNNNARLPANDPAAIDLISLTTAMEEAFEWVHIPR